VFWRNLIFWIPGHASDAF